MHDVISLPDATSSDKIDETLGRTHLGFYIKKYHKGTSNQSWQIYIVFRLPARSFIRTHELKLVNLAVSEFPEIRPSVRPSVRSPVCPSLFVNILTLSFITRFFFHVSYMDL